MAGSKAAFERLLAAGGVQLDGPGPFDFRVRNDAFYSEALPRGLLGIGEAYVDGWWESDQLDVTAYRVLASGDQISGADRLSLLAANLKAKLFNLQSPRRARRAAREHYDLGNDLFCAMLDRRMVYSCGYWKNARTLDEAQEAKLDLICRKLRLEPGMRVLDIGCGWGSFGKFAAEHYGVSVLGVTISEEQAHLGRALCAGLPVELRVEDYRDLHGTFDAVVSVGMFEHVGCKSYRHFMRIVRQCLKPGRLFLLQTIGGSATRVRGDPWLTKYIFPNGMLPSARQIAEACEGVLLIEDWHNFGPDYDKTAMAWFRNFDAHWPQLRDKYGDRFYRIWKYYLHASAAAFRARINHLWQIVFSAGGVPGGYGSVR